MVADKIVELQDAIGVELTKAYLVPAFTVTRKFKYKFLDPYWQILENSSRNFPEISVFWGVTQTDFWKTRPLDGSSRNWSVARPRIL